MFVCCCCCCCCCCARTGSCRHACPPAHSARLCLANQQPLADEARPPRMRCDAPAYRDPRIARHLLLVRPRSCSILRIQMGHPQLPTSIGRRSMLSGNLALFCTRALPPQSPTMTTNNDRHNLYASRPGDSAAGLKPRAAAASAPSASVGCFIAPRACRRARLGAKPERTAEVDAADHDPQHPSWFGQQGVARRAPSQRTCAAAAAAQQGC
jgi:hypothetical protein